MSLAWTTIIFILLMLPGVAVLIGMAAFERFSRELVRSTALGEIALAAFMAILIHSACIGIVSLIFPKPLDILRPIIVFETQSKVVLVWPLVRDALPIVTLYTLITAVIGLCVGLGISKMISSGPLRFLATHSWIYDVVKYSKAKHGLVTAYVMTKTVENDIVLMYTGRLAEIFLKQDGNISYLALTNCRRFYMKFDDLTTTGRQLTLFNNQKHDYSFNDWNYLMISEDEIANVLFNRSPDIIESQAGLNALETALEEAQAKDEAALKGHPPANAN